MKSSRQKPLDNSSNLFQLPQHKCARPFKSVYSSFLSRWLQLPRKDQEQSQPYFHNIDQSRRKIKSRIQIAFHTHAQSQSHPSQSLLRSYQLLPRKKIFTVHGSNREKEGIANMLRIHVNGSFNILLLGGCICIPFLGMEWERYKVRIYTRETHRARADSRSLWVAEQSLSRQGKRASFESVVT